MFIPVSGKTDPAVNHVGTGIFRLLIPFTHVPLLPFLMPGSDRGTAPHAHNPPSSEPPSAEGSIWQFDPKPPRSDLLSSFHFHPFYPDPLQSPPASDALNNFGILDAFPYGFRFPEAV